MERDITPLCCFIPRMPEPWTLTDARRVGGIVSTPGEVIQLVGMSRSLFPNAHTEIAILWRSPGVREFRPIAMPCDQGIVDWRPVRRAGFVAFGGECRVPHSDDRIGIVRNEQERTWLDSSQPMPPLRVKARRQPDG